MFFKKQGILKFHTLIEQTFLEPCCLEHELSYDHLDVTRLGCVLRLIIWMTFLLDLRIVLSHPNRNAPQKFSHELLIIPTIKIKMLYGLIS